MDLTTMTPTPVQKINSGYLEFMLDILHQFEKALEKHNSPNCDERERVSRLKLELVDVKHETERLFDQVCDREIREGAIELEQMVDTIVGNRLGEVAA